MAAAEQEPVGSTPEELVESTAVELVEVRSWLEGLVGHKEPEQAGHSFELEEHTELEERIELVERTELEEHTELGASTVLERTLGEEELVARVMGMEVEQF